MKEIYLGLMSGTSIDAIDAVLVDFSSSFPELIATHSLAYPDEIRQQLAQLVLAQTHNLELAASLDVQLGELFAQAANQLIAKAEINKELIKAIGSHGQTIRHRPGARFPFTLQIADPNIIAARTGLTTVADFRRRDVAEGGQGAPFAPAFHAEFYRDSKIPRIVLNLGGIANVTYLPPASDELLGFDTGPANALLDAWCELATGRAFDDSGAWAKTGCVDQGLLQLLLADPYFAKAAPKSTGREYFNLAWLSQYLSKDLEPVNVQATLAELTAHTVTAAIKQVTPIAEVLVCGGGIRNKDLIARIAHELPGFSVRSISDLGIDAQWIEAVAFAWLAQCRLKQKAVDLCSVTGAGKPSVLGAIFV